MIDTDNGFAPLLARRAQADPSGMFARYDGDPVNFGDLDRMANTLALWMRRIGLAPGDPVALMLRIQTASEVALRSSSLKVTGAPS